MKYNYVDLDIEFTKKKNGDIQEFIGVDAVKSSIKNIIETLLGRRRMLPEFAGRLWTYIFEPMDEVTAYAIGEELLGAIERWDSRVIIENVNVKPRYDYNRYDVKISFRLQNSRPEELDEVETIIQRG